MGEVYRAKDQVLGRDVAIKVLPEEFAKDPDRAARFERQAKLLALRNHPNIASNYGLEDWEQTTFLVMELVEGPTLADRIRQGPIPLDESLEIARQIADALEAAHEKGIVHRDLKPGNIKLRPDGTVKVLDFGLAKVKERTAVSLETSPTLSVAQTAAGVLLGTAVYMSPEQARGKGTVSNQRVFGDEGPHGNLTRRSHDCVRGPNRLDFPVKERTLSPGARLVPYKILSRI